MDRSVLTAGRTMGLWGVVLVVIRTVARWELQGQGWRLTGSQLGGEGGCVCMLPAFDAFDAFDACVCVCVCVAGPRFC